MGAFTSSSKIEATHPDILEKSSNVPPFFQKTLMLGYNSYFITGGTICD
jgi:hypothetical protein